MKIARVLKPRGQCGPAGCSEVSKLRYGFSPLLPWLAFFAMEQELSEIVGRKVDLNTLQFLSPEFRSQVEREAETQYEQA